MDTDVELGSDARATDPPQLDLEGEKVEVLAGDVVEPVEGGTMFLGEAICHPDDGHCVEARRVSEKLSKMCVVGSLELVLNEDPRLWTWTTTYSQNVSEPYTTQSESSSITWTVPEKPPVEMSSPMDRPPKRHEIGDRRRSE